MIAAYGAYFERDALEVSAQHAVVTRIVEQEGVVAMRRVDLGVAHVDAVVDQRLDDLARACRREAPVGREADQQEAVVPRRREGSA